jgi:hypothetical protein
MQSRLPLQKIPPPRKFFPFPQKKYSFFKDLDITFCLKILQRTPTRKVLQIKALQEKRSSKGYTKMTFIKNLITKFKKKNLGQATLEYIIISSLIGIFCLFTMKRIGIVLQKRLAYIKTHIVKNLPMER